MRCTLALGIFFAASAAACGGGAFTTERTSQDHDGAPDVAPVDDAAGADVLGSEDSADRDGAGSDVARRDSGALGEGGGVGDDASDAGAPHDAGAGTDASGDGGKDSAPKCTPLVMPASAPCYALPTFPAVCAAGSFCATWPLHSGYGQCEPLPHECLCAETWSCGCLLAHVPSPCGDAAAPAACVLDGGSVTVYAYNGGNVASWTVTGTSGAAMVVCTPDGGVGP